MGQCRGRTGSIEGGFARDFESGAARQFLDGLYELHVFVIHQEGDGGAMFTATKTMVELFDLADGEGGGLFTVERAAGLVFTAGLFQGYAAIDDLDNIRAVKQFVDK